MRSTPRRRMVRPATNSISPLLSVFAGAVRPCAFCWSATYFTLRSDRRGRSGLKIAVTGGSGQLGTLLLRRLAVDREVKQLLSIDLRPPLVASGKLTHIQRDIRAPDLAALFEGYDVVVHLAFVVTRYLRRSLFDDINIRGSGNVFEAAVRAGISHLVCASSIAAYGVVPGHPIPIVETTPRRYQEEFPYAAAKFKVEELLDAVERNQPRMAVTRMRPSILIGRYMDHPFGRAMRRRIFSTGNAPLVWDQDVADAFALAIKKRIAGAFNLSADPVPRLDHAARELGMRVLKFKTGLSRAALVSAVAIRQGLSRLGIGEGIDSAWVKHGRVPMVISSERARTILGWKPICSTAADVLRRFAIEVPRRLDRRIRASMSLVRWASLLQARVPELRGVAARVHLCLTGPGGGDYALEVADGRLLIGSRLPRPPTSVMIMDAQLWLDLLAGRMDLASAQFTGRIRVEGDPFGGFLLGGILAQLKEGAAASGTRGRLARAFSAWLAAGGRT